MFHQIIRQQSSFRCEVLGSLDVACLLGRLRLLHVLTDLADAFLLGWVHWAGGNLLQIGICRGQLLGDILALAGGLRSTYAGG